MSRLDKSTRELLRDPEKRRPWIIYQLNIRSTNLAAIARQIGVTRHCMYHVFDGPYPRMEKAIADALDLKPQDIWPDRYDADGLPNRRRGRPSGKSLTKDTRQNGGRNIKQKAVA